MRLVNNFTIAKLMSELEHARFKNDFYDQTEQQTKHNCRTLVY